jgi:hypothetical protein
MVSSVRASHPLRDEQSDVRRLVVAWQDPVTGGVITPIGILERTDRGYTFSYLRRARDLPGFRPLLGLGELHHYESAALFPLFRQRLMDSRRPDYGRYLTVLGLSDGVDALAELGRSGGRRADDSIFMVPEPYIGDHGRTSADFFVHGPRRAQPGGTTSATASVPRGLAATTSIASLTQAGATSWLRALVTPTKRSAWPG